MARTAARTERKSGSSARPGIVLDPIVVGLQEGQRRGAIATIDQVHEQEGDIVEQVDLRERLIELDAVEQHRSTAEQHDVLEVQVTVAVANEAGAPPGVQLIGGTIQGLVGRGNERLDRVGRKNAGNRAAQVLDIAGYDVAHRRRAAGIGQWLESLVKGDNRAGERLDQGIVEAAAPCHVVEPASLGKAGHDQQPLDRLAGAVDAEFARCLGHRHDCPVEIGGGAPVEAQLGLERCMAGGSCAKVEKAEAHRLLHLVGPIAAQEQDRRMRLDPLDRRRQHSSDPLGNGRLARCLVVRRAGLYMMGQ